MTAPVVSGSNIVSQFGVFVDGHQTASFSQLLGYLAIMSIGIWALVVLSTLLRIIVRRIFKYRINLQRR
jgi:hypothetical protein